jgi:hypothetical protein
MAERLKSEKATYRKVSAEELEVGVNIAVNELKEVLVHSMIGLNALIGKQCFLEVLEEAVKVTLSVSDEAQQAGRKAVKEAWNAFHQRKILP